jgi:replication factor C subunit 1
MFDPLSKKGQDGINEVINFMDHYHITKDDFDCINEIFMKKLPDIPTSVKSAFTRTYNKLAHPTVSTYKSSNGGGRADNSRPDFEDILEDEEGPDEEEEEEEKLEDKMIKIPKKKEQKKKESNSKTKAKKK